MSEITIPVPGRLHTVADGGYVVGADEVYDDTLGQSQSEVNQSKMDLIAYPFSEEKNYIIGISVIYNNDIYRCIVAHAAGPWDSSHFANARNNIVLTTLKGSIWASDKKLTDLQEKLTYDSVPTAGSDNPVSSKGLKTYLDPIIDVPIPFASDEVKAKVVESFGGITGGSTNIPGIRGEITYRQAYAVTSLGNSWFYNAGISGTFNELKYFRNLQQIPSSCFRSSGLTSISVPEGVLRVLAGCFGDLTAYVELPSTLTTIIDNTFWYGTGKCTVKLYATTPPTIDSSKNTNILKVMVPQAALTTYQANAQWSQYTLEGF